MTRSPTAKLGDACADCGDDVPAISWPKMRGAEWEPLWIFLRSVPQMPQVAILTSSSPGPMRGNGNGFNAHVVDAAIDHGAHGGGNAVDSTLEFQGWRFG